MQQVQVAFKIDKSTRDLARNFNLNLSEICRKAIEEEIGLHMKQNPDALVSTKTALEKYAEFLESQRMYQEKLLENITLVSRNMNKKQAEKAEQAAIIDKIIAKLDHDLSGGTKSLQKYLPEKDYWQTYTSSSDELADQLSAILKIKITREQLFAAIRKAAGY